MDSRMLGMRELAERLDTSYFPVRSSWRRWDLTRYRIGGCIKFRVTDVDAWLERQIIDTAAGAG